MSQSVTTKELDDIHDHCIKAKLDPLDDALGESLIKRGLGRLDRVLVKINELRKKSTKSALPNNDKDLVIKDWGFVDKYYEDHGSLNWETIFKLGKAKGLFANYSKWTSASICVHLRNFNILAQTNKAYLMTQYDLIPFLVTTADWYQCIHLSIYQRRLIYVVSTTSNNRSLKFYQTYWQQDQLQTLGPSGPIPLKNRP
ncbi:hypothetical protein PHYBLDRAFT_64604 [Phycomyces blakesleeanus NRRL 1555(-)]|uniref:Uncharacterized protein n=1 Tax=Phycomyces blakesleeanus (strain ATCC 8743b / DSM 1359 / FGSC 10004 / NBRC 33097 / NRRL 1555) TaxID=763407 RepID=A0A162N3Q6_PHYB8|nr:hypothetical protein PHYBLDRAFT_64604 [Phycomyces blakesleeanus NRRL 1555(-)]OAD65534.1 hypothetical protein PHYBLDRAFT_64604 [Phycomyces blakesleeanus NRRL 1555(-)]|eukprot:XP_018283574.1 hypothetical protein PHYBLDRAFT_64604 [Phycomyces blakesleeanus NRRL 1555(-)]